MLSKNIWLIVHPFQRILWKWDIEREGFHKPEPPAWYKALGSIWFDLPDLPARLHLSVLVIDLVVKPV